MGLLKKSVITVILAVILKYIAERVIFFDIWKITKNHAPGPCKLLDGVDNGSEDMQTLPNGLAFITSGIKYLQMVGNPKFKHLKGKIYLFDFNAPETPPVELKLHGVTSVEDFAPQGISLWKNTEGAVFVYVVNHLVMGDQVDKFLFDDKNLALKHLKTIKHKNFRILNDLVVLEDDNFYISNYMWSKSSFGWTLEMFAGLHWGQILYFDGNASQVVADGLSFPNGMNISPDKQYVYVAALASQDVHIFSRQPDNTLERKQTVKLYTCLDNIDVNTESGQVELWIGAHPIVWQLLEHLDYKREDAPSQVLRITLDGDRVVSVTEVYADDGHRLFGSSVANKYKDAMLVGSVRHKLMYCKLNYVGN